MLRQFHIQRCLTDSSRGAGIHCRAFATGSVPPQEYRARRERFFRCLEPNTVLLLPAADEAIHSNDILHHFRQESTFYHLFGLNEPMRRALSPPGCSSDPENFKLTCAVLAKLPPKDGQGPAATVTRVFVPHKTTDPAVLPWAEESRSLQDFSDVLFADAGGPHGEVCENDLETIVRHVTWAVAVSVALKRKDGTNGERLRSGGLRPSALKAMNPLPALLVHLPRQLRWTGEVFRMPAPEAGAKAQRYARFSHPLEALMDALYSLEIKVPSSDGGLTLSCHYQQPSGRALLPGISCPSPQQQQLLRELYPSELVRVCAPATDGAAHSVDGGDAHEKLRAGSLSLSLSLPIRLPARELATYRLVKSPWQVAQHVRSAAATQYAFAAAMRRAADCTSERDVYSAFRSAVNRLPALLPSSGPQQQQALVSMAYIPVIAAGVSAAKIHYTRNAGTCVAGDYLRLDGGVEVDLVPTDCARTFPAGRGSTFGAEDYSPRRDLYVRLLELQRQLLRGVRSGVDPRSIALDHVDATAELLESIGVRPRAGKGGEAPTACQLVQELFCTHSFGHFFGLDIHETVPPRKVGPGSVSGFCGGMMHTVEPGVYIPAAGDALYERLHYDPRAAGIPAELMGVGVQVEDDILILPARDESPCDWTRAEYLAAVRGAYDALESAAMTRGGLDPFTLPFWRTHVPRLLHYREALERDQWIALLLIFMQRASLEGWQAARERLLEDGERILQHPAGAADPSAPWYPFDIVVTTSFTPKDIELIEYVMSTQREDH